MIAALIGGIVMLVLLAVDLITKMFAEAYLVDVPFIPGFMNFSFTKNYGMAFGTFENTKWAMDFIVTPLTVVLIAVIAVLFFTIFKKNRPAQVCLSVIEAGAVGNLIDRLCLGYVRDFVDVSAFRPFAWLGSNFNFGNCNIADFCITFGAVALLIVILFVGKDAVFPLGKYRRQRKQEPAAEPIGEPITEPVGEPVNDPANVPENEPENNKPEEERHGE